ncbi:MAG: hypothetical protein H6807_14205 [Planctomycetes bacterium]|nr:hypothetical protein [Planctomycetota bacterium]
MSELPDPQEDALAELLGDLLDRKNRGEDFDLEALKREHPGFAREIESFLGMDEVFADALGDAVLDHAFGDDVAQLAERFPLADRLDDTAFGSLHRLRAEPGGLPRELITADPMFGRGAHSRLAASLRHAALYQAPGFARILDHGRLDGRAYVVRECLVGPSLRELVDRILESGRMLPAAEREGEGRPVDRVEQAGRCAASPAHLARLARHFRAWSDILDGGHLRGLVHRELNPDNLGFGANGQAMIQGIGLAWQGTRIEPRLMRGWTPQWLAPEVVDPSWGPVSHLADVYSLGRALSDALALDMPQPADDAAGLLMHIAVGDRAFLELLPRALPASLRELIEQATFPDPSRRLSSLAEFGQRLAEILPPIGDEPRSWAARLFGR